MDATNQKPTAEQSPSDGAPLDGAPLDGTTLTAPAKRKGGQIGNLNALRTGGKLTRIIAGELPPALSHVQRNARRYKRALEQAVLDRHGSIDLQQAHYVDTASTHEMLSMIMRWSLNHNWPTLTVKEVIALTTNLAHAKADRDKAVAALKLETDKDDWIAKLYAPDPPAAPQTSDPQGMGFDLADQETTQP